MKTILDFIGETPLVPLTRLTVPNGCRILAKLEFLNPGGSIKDRIVRYIVEDAEGRGILRAGATIVESTSGNTGAAIALLAAQKGYRAILTMPDKVSREKQDALRALGVDVVVCPTAARPGAADHYVERARRIAAGTPNSFMIDQYDNPRNVEAHYRTTGPEIWRQALGRVDIFVASGSTGGTISGVSRYLKQQNPSVRAILLDPIGSIYHSYFETGRFDAADIRPYKVEGVGEDHLAKCMDFSLIDDVIQFSDDDAFACARELAKREGLLCGGSSGANVWGALRVAERSKDATIVTVLPDSGIKYLSKIFGEAPAVEPAPSLQMQAAGRAGLPRRAEAGIDIVPP